jgi:Fe-S oxidoreductase
MMTVAIGQSKLFREPVAGLMHAFIFWGFLVLLTSVLEAIGEGLVPEFSFRFIGFLYKPLAFCQDLFAGLVIIGVFIALFRRYIIRPKRLQVDRHAQIDATIILFTIMIIMVSMLGQNAVRLQLGSYDEGRFLTVSLSSFLTSPNASTNQTLFEIYWWIHIVLVLGFLNYLPYSKHAHVLTSVPNVFLTSLGPKGALKPINLEAEGVEKFGAADVDDLTWKQLLDGFTCTECGRCSASCPANTTGKVLSPKKIMTDIRHRTTEKGKTLLNGDKTAKIKEGEKNPSDNLLLHNYITQEELFACTTCMACMQECPVNNEHIPSIVELRRSLVLMESNFPPEVQVVFKNLETNFSPWAFPASSRADWAEGMNILQMSQTQDVDILFWVGCAGAFDARYTKVTQAFAKLMQKAGIKFAILGTEEKCTGDSARRIGNEYLAQILIKDNVATLNRYNVKKIVTTCPHCFNTLKNEYPQFGGNYEVVHHTEFLVKLINEGRLKISKEEAAQITFHDSCYLGRYNDIYKQPRKILSAIPGLQTVEMKRSRSKGFCCGAGGGRMWMEEKEGKRVNIERTEEALALKPNIIGTACPFCLTMLEDGVKDKEATETVKVKDIAEILLAAVE